MKSSRCASKTGGVSKSLKWRQHSEMKMRGKRQTGSAVNELTQLVRAREQALDQKEGEVAKGQELLEHDRDIRELMGARELYMADVHDVSGKGTAKTYGRVFYTKGKSLIVYAFDLDAQPGFQNAKSFQAWVERDRTGRKRAVWAFFYQDNASKKRWVLKADDPKTLEDIDAVFVTIEPHEAVNIQAGSSCCSPRFASARTIRDTQTFACLKPSCLQTPNS